MSRIAVFTEAAQSYDMNCFIIHGMSRLCQCISEMREDTGMIEPEPIRSLGRILVLIH